MGKCIVACWLAVQKVIGICFSKICISEKDLTPGKIDDSSKW